MFRSLRPAWSFITYVGAKVQNLHLMIFTPFKYPGGRNLNLGRKVMSKGVDSGMLLVPAYIRFEKSPLDGA